MTLAPNSHPESTKVLSAPGVAKTNTIRNCSMPKPYPGWSSIVFMKISCSVSTYSAATLSPTWI
jgi:hypothetical protein